MFVWGVGVCGVVGVSSCSSLGHGPSWLLGRRLGYKLSIPCQ